MGKLKDRHVQVGSVAMGDIEPAKVALNFVKCKQAKEQETEQREFKLMSLSHEDLRAGGNNWHALAPERRFTCVL